MTLKNWKRTKADDTWIDYEKKSHSSYSGDGRVSINKMYSDKIINNPIKNKYSWVVTYGDSITENRVFKTKTQALNFAKKYMRSH